MSENHGASQGVCVGGNLAEILAQRKQANGNVRKSYKNPQSEQKTALLAADIRGKAEALRQLAKVDRVNFDDLEAVQGRVSDYMESCAMAGVFPSFQGLCVFALGRERQAVYAYLKQHPDTSTAQFLNLVRDAIADIISNAGLQRVSDNVMSIFLLKNSHGFSDRVEIEPVQPRTDAEAFSADVIRRRYMIDDE